MQLQFVPRSGDIPVPPLLARLLPRFDAVHRALTAASQPSGDARSRNTKLGTEIPSRAVKLALCSKNQEFFDNGAGLLLSTHCGPSGPVPRRPTRPHRAARLRRTRRRLEHAVANGSRRREPRTHGSGRAAVAKEAGGIEFLGPSQRSNACRLQQSMAVCR
jgi:hypothetical protein